MPDDRTVLDHLLEGRDALVLEVKRLSTAIEELDAVIGQIGGGHRRLGNASDASALAANSPIYESVVQAPASDEPVNPPVEVEPAPRPVRPRRSGARKSAARKATRQSESPKSIRVHVLEMLDAEDREFGLAEIIDRVHDAGIAAHDDAVRSITIKLMKDGRVERVGRGQYRLARRGAARHGAEDAIAASATVEAASSDQDGSDESEPGQNDIDQNDIDQNDESAADQNDEQPGQPQSSYTPPLNLGQPWN